MTSQSTRDLPAAVKEFIDYVCDSWNYDISFEQHLLSTVDNPHNALAILNTCDCCDRHNINKPTHVTDKINNNYNIFKFDNSCNCTCKCRHISRFICRSFNPKIKRTRSE